MSFLVYNISCLCFVHARDIDCFAFNRVLVKWCPKELFLLYLSLSIPQLPRSVDLFYFILFWVSSILSELFYTISKCCLYDNHCSQWSRVYINAMLLFTAVKTWLPCEMWGGFIIVSNEEGKLKFSEISLGIIKHVKYIFIRLMRSLKFRMLYGLPLCH